MGLDGTRNVGGAPTVHVWVPLGLLAEWMLCGCYVDADTLWYLWTVGWLVSAPPS